MSEPSDDELYGVHDGGGWISGSGGGPSDENRESFAAYITDDHKGWVPVNRGHWHDDAGPVEGSGPAE